MASFPATWPAEIISLFVDEVAKEVDDARQNTALSACMLVSKAFYFPSCKHRFTNIEIPIRLYPKNHVKSMAAFLDVLKANSGLLQYMQTFTLLLDGSNPIKWTRNAQDFAPKVAILSRIVEMVSRTTIHTLSIKSKDHKLNIRDFGEEWQALLVALRCIPSIKVLCLKSIGDPPRALVVGDPASDTLEELHLFNVRFSRHREFRCPRRSSRIHSNFMRWRHVFEAGSTTSLLPLSRLQVLRLDNVCYFHSFLQISERETPLPPPTLPRLRSFTSSGADKSYMNSGERDDVKLLDQILPSLECLSLMRDPLRRGFGLVRDQLDFAGFQNLRRLEVSGWERDNNCLPELCRLLSCVTTPTKIESLSVTITRWAYMSVPFPAHSRYAEWSILDRILNNGHFSALRAFTLDLKYCQQSNLTITRVQEAEREAYISSLLPLLSTNQRILFHLKSGAEEPM